MECHPLKLLLQKHKKIIPSLLTQPKGKNYRIIRIRPPRQMINKWFFQDHFAETGLFTLKAAACDLRYSYFGCCNTNSLVTFLCLNLQFYQNAGWGNDKGGTTWYVPYSNIKKQVYQLKQPDGKTVSQDMTTFDYKKSIGWDTGWFSWRFLQAVQIIAPGEDVVASSAGRYNPTIDTGRGNSIWLVSALKLSYTKPSDEDLFIDEQPLWLALYGFCNWVQKKKKTPLFLKHITYAYPVHLFSQKKVLVAYGYQ